MSQLLCPSCGEMRSAADGYCPACGAELIPARFCERCGVIAMHSGDHCRECGAALPPVEALPQMQRATEPDRQRPLPWAEPPPRDEPPEWVRTAPAPQPKPVSPSISLDPPPAAPLATPGAADTTPAYRGATVAATPTVAPIVPISRTPPEAPLRGTSLLFWTIATLVLITAGIIATTVEPIALPLLLIVVAASIRPLRRLAYSLLTAFVETFSVAGSDQG